MKAFGAIGGLLALSASFMSQSCNRTDSLAAESRAAEAPVQVTRGGFDIDFSPRSAQLGQIGTDTVRSQELELGITAPAHVVVAIARSEFQGNIYLFETQDLTQLYAEFTKSSSALTRSSRQYERVKDLRYHKAVAEKDLQDAEHDYAEARAELGEKESRLRASGIDPRELEKTPPGYVWIIADIPEDQLQKISRQTRGEISCNSFPGETWEGRLLSTGEVIDPATRTFKANLLVPNREGKLRPGMFGTVAFRQPSENVLTVPRAAVINLQGKAYIFTCSGRTFHRTEVQIGSETRERYIVTGGVRNGDVIASSGVILLKQLSFGY